MAYGLQFLSTWMFRSVVLAPADHFRALCCPSIIASADTNWDYSAFTRRYGGYTLVVSLSVIAFGPVVIARRTRFCFLLFAFCFSGKWCCAGYAARLAWGVGFFTYGIWAERHTNWHSDDRSGLSELPRGKRGTGMGPGVSAV